MATLTLGNGREFNLHNTQIISYLQGAEECITDIEQLLSITIRSQLHDELNSIVNKLNTKNNSSELGAIGEKYIQDKLTEMNVPWSDTSSKPHNADIEFNICDNIVFMDVKNYSKPVPTQEIDKLFRDCEENNIKYGVLLSLKSAISKRKTFDIEKRVDTHVLHVIYNTKYDLNIMMNILSTLIRLESENKNNFINKDRMYECLQMINTKATDITQLKIKLASFKEDCDRYNRDTLSILNRYQHDIDDILLEMKHECNSPSGMSHCEKSDIMKNFPYKQWLFIIEDLWKSTEYQLNFTKEMSKFDLIIQNNTVAQFTFQKTKVLVQVIAECKCVYHVETQADWNCLMTKLLS